MGWAAFGMAIGIVAGSPLTQLDARPGGGQRLLDVALVAIGGRLIGVSVLLTGTTLTWLVFVLALGLVGTAFTGPPAHEVGSWRSIHQLGQLPGLRPGRRPGEGLPAEGVTRAA